MQKRVRPKISRLYQDLRRAHGEWNAATFTELHRSGFPHWHALIRGPYVSHPEIRRRWRDLTGSYVIDIRAINDPKVATQYVQKYVTKQMCQVRGLRLGYVVTFTRKYSPPPPKQNDPTPYTWTIDKRHPVDVQESSYKTWNSQWKGNVCYLTPAETDWLTAIDSHRQ